MDPPVGRGPPRQCSTGAAPRQRRRRGGREARGRRLRTRRAARPARGRRSRRRARRGGTRGRGGRRRRSSSIVRSSSIGSSAPDVGGTSGRTSSIGASSSTRAWWRYGASVIACLHERHRIRRVGEPHEVAGRHDVDEAVDAERPPVVAVAVVGDEVPAPRRLHEPVRVERALRLATAGVAVADAEPLAVATGAGQRRRAARRRPARCVPPSRDVIASSAPTWRRSVGGSSWSSLARALIAASPPPATMSPAAAAQRDGDGDRLVAIEHQRRHRPAAGAELVAAGDADRRRAPGSRAGAAARRRGARCAPSRRAGRPAPGRSSAAGPGAATAGRAAGRSSPASSSIADRLCPKQDRSGPRSRVRSRPWRSTGTRELARPARLPVGRHPAAPPRRADRRAAAVGAGRRDVEHPPPRRRDVADGRRAPATP